MVKKPKGVSSDLSVTGQWEVVVRRIMNGTGVLKVYLIQSKKYAYCLKFVRAIAPEWVLAALKNIGADANIGFEDRDVTEENKVQEMIADANQSKMHGMKAMLNWNQAKERSSPKLQESNQKCSCQDQQHT